MATYTVQDTTMKALGDAVRSKVLGTTELPIIRGETGEMVLNSEVPIQLPDYVKKMKVKGHKTVLNEGYMEVYQGIGIAPNYYNDEYLARMDAGYFVIEGSNVYEFDFDILVEGNVLTFLCSYRDTNYGSMSLTYEIIGLDENGNEFKYTPAEMVDKINGLEIPNIQPIVLSSNQPYGCSGSIASSYVRNFGDTISTQDIVEASYMFLRYENETIPFVINLGKTCNTMTGMFNGCFNLKTLPKVIGVEKNIPTSAYSENLTLNDLFYNCWNLKEIPNDFFWKVVPNKEYWDKANELHSGVNIGSMFYNCYSLRELPDLSMLERSKLAYYYSPYNFGNCYNLNKITNLSVHGANAGWTSNVFSSSSFSNIYRLSNMTFAVNEDGTPKTANWKNQTIILSDYVGWVTNNSYKSYILNYNSGITADKEVTDDATYQALKDDPDWFSCDINYSRYNHDSAVNTINSLPDTSAYLASNGGTNTIKFKGQSGALTDGGAINTLTEEEIAVATSRGWTVSLV